MRKVFRSQRAQLGEINARTEDCLLGIRVVKSFGREDTEVEKFEKDNSKFLDIKKQSYKYMGAFNCSTRAFDGIMYIIVVALGSYTPLFDKAMSNVIEVKARGASVLALATESHRAEMESRVDGILTIPDTELMFLPLLGVVPLQLFAYYVALQRGCDIDKPRNLAKSVTVE